MLTWFTVYKDGSVHEYDPKTYNIAHVDLARLDKFAIIDEGSEIPYFQIHFDDPRKRLIYIRRTEHMTTLPEPLICHMVGWQMKVKGENIQVITYIFETIQWTKGKDESGRKHLIWSEQAGKYNRKRDGHFSAPTPKQLSIIGSKPEEQK